jgi:peptidoglycan L-alanyl-D-glutamate endopeptidase CwlK
MPKFSAASEKMLEGVHPKLVQVCREAILIMDFSVVDGVRTKEEQAINVARGVSWTKNSKHLIQSDGFSHAVDLGPYVTGIDWQDKEMFCVLAGVMFTCAHRLGIKIRWGGDWDQDRRTTDERNRDYGHFELVLN